MTVSAIHQNSKLNNWRMTRLKMRIAIRIACLELLRSCSENIPGANLFRVMIPNVVITPYTLKNKVR